MEHSALSKDTLRMFDKKAQSILGIPENILIENASRGLLDVLSEQNILPCKIGIVSGRGNNAADSLALARHLINRDIDVDVFLALNRKGYNRQVEFQLNILKKIMDRNKITILNDTNDFCSLGAQLVSKDWLIDGIFGIGFKPPLDDFYKELFRIINSLSKNILAVDIPSGLSCDEGCIDEVAVKAKITLSFIGPKLGFFKDQGPLYTGKIVVKDIGISYNVLNNL